MNKKQSFLAFSLLVIFLSISYIFYLNKSKLIETKIYTKKSIALKNKLKELIKEKEGIAESITYVMSKDKHIVQAILNNDKSLVKFDEILKGLHKKSQFKNMWVQIVDKNGYSLYRSWTSKCGELVTNVRQDIAMFLNNPKTMNHVSTGKAGMTFKSIQPIYDNNGKFIGLIEMITKFNSIANKLTNFDIEPIFLVNEYYTKKIKMPFTKIFLDGHYVANLNASKSLMQKIKEYDIHNFLHLKKYLLFDKYLLTTHTLKTIDDQQMAEVLLFYQQKNIDMSDLKSFQLSFLLYIILFIVIATIVLWLLLLYNRSKYFKSLNKLLKKEKDKAQRITKIKSEFLANMSHEIRTPLNAIVGFVDLLKEQAKDTKSLEYIDVIHFSSQSLLKIIEDILDFSKIDSGKMAIDKIDFNTKKEFESIIQLFSAKCSKKNIKLTLELDKKLPESINTDPLRLRQIISNLLSNAIKFTDIGKAIKVSALYKGKKLYVFVEDEGKGIANKKQKHIFDAFSQEDNSTTRNYGGSGLGLTISSELVKLLGGELKLKSELTKGSIFYFYIPVKIGKFVKEQNTNILNIQFKNSKILLVEDNVANQMFMKILLKKLNLEFDIANDGLEAIDKFKNNQYDLILMDENMPNLNGIEATYQIRQIEKLKNLKHMPIVALTANALTGDRKRFLESGMDEYLTKPLNKNALTQVLLLFLSNKVSSTE